MASIDKVNDIAPRRQYVALAGQTAFDYPFPIFNASDVVVDVDGVTKALNVDYTVSGAGNDTGGTVTFASPLAGGEVVTLYRDIAITRDTDFQQNGPFRADALNDELDKAFLILQQLKASHNRALRMPVTASATDAQMELAPLDNWRGRYVTINAQGVPEPADLVPGTISQSVIGQLLYPQTAAEVAAGVTPTNYGYPPGDVRRYGYVADGVDDGTDTGTDNTLALQRCIDCNAVTFIPEGVGLFDYLTIPANRMIVGCGERSTTLRQLTTSAGDPANGAAVLFDDDTSTDISDHPRKIKNICIKANEDCHGIYIGAVNASMLEFRNLRLWNQHQEAVVSMSPPYSTPSGKRGIFVEAGGTGAVFVAQLTAVEIRSFDVAVEASGGVNEWKLDACWFLDCRVNVRLNNCSTWNLNGLTVESGVSAARALQLFNEVSNLIVTGGRWELTRPTSESGGCYGVEGDGTVTGQNIRIRGVNTLINGDGSAIPGRKWTGTLPDDTVIEGYDNIAGSLRPFVVVPNFVAMRFPNEVVLGGTGLGNGKVTLGRNSGGSPASIENTSEGRLKLDGANSSDLSVNGSVTLRADDSATANDVRLLVWDVSKGGLARVSVGDVDSGGSGFKVLRVPN